MQVSRKEISAILKANGIKPSHVGSRYARFTGGASYSITIKHYSVSQAKLKKILGFLENIDRDEHGWIQSGGNTYLSFIVDDGNKNFFKGLDSQAENFNQMVVEFDSIDEDQSKEATFNILGEEKKIFFYKEIGGCFTFGFKNDKGEVKMNHDIRLVFDYKKYDMEGCLKKLAYRLFHA